MFEGAGRWLNDISSLLSAVAAIAARVLTDVQNGDDENLRALGPMPWSQVWRVGTAEGNDVRIVASCGLQGYTGDPEKKLAMRHVGMGSPNELFISGSTSHLLVTSK